MRENKWGRGDVGWGKSKKKRGGTWVIGKKKKRKKKKRRNILREYRRRGIEWEMMVFWEL